ncbi:MAG: VanW family protein [Oscillibacter sp.]|nr:VanW family protein [Oscillibacter sp.]
MANQISMGSNADNTGANPPPQTAPEPQNVSGGVGRTIFSAVRMTLAAFIIAGAIVSAGYAGLCAYAANGKAIWPGINVMGVELSGLTVEEAAKKLDDFIDKAHVDLYLYYIEDEGTGVEKYRPKEPDYSFPLRDLGFYPDTTAIAQEAYDMNVTEPDFFSLGWRYLTGEGETEYAPILKVDPEAVAERAAEAAEALSYPITEIEYGFEGDNLRVVMPRNGRAVEAEPIAEKLLPIIQKSPDFSIDIPYSAVRHEVKTAQEIRDEIYVPVKNAYFDAKTWSAAPGSEGTDINAEALQEIMNEATPGQVIEVGLIHNQPTLTYSELKDVVFRDLLGEASTNVSGTAARVSNVRLAAKAINNAVVNSGEVFSYNGRVGRRTTAKGYQAAPAYVQGLTVDEIGGGVCQPSSTLYLATLRSNLQITERSPHRYVPAYIPAGMDATVSWGGPDYKFTNNTPYPILIRTFYSNGTLTVQLYGTKTNKNTVKITNEFISSTQWKTEYVTDKTLPKGTSKVTVTPYVGKTYKTYRNIYNANGELISSKLEATSVYKVRNQVIARNP